MSVMLSPAVYLRCSENSTENPWNGLAWSPEMNPSTMNLARRSSRATWRITSGFKYFSAVLDTRGNLALNVADKRIEAGFLPVSARRSGDRSSPLILGHFGLLDL